MSRAIASARQRRAGINPEPPQQQQQQQSQQMQPQGLTLPQVISVVDARLIKLEKFMNEYQPHQSQQHDVNKSTEPLNISQSLIDEFQSRFDLLAQELMTLKDIVLKLQSYTMDVNKLLLEDREVLTEPNTGLFELQNFDENKDLTIIEESSNNEF